MATEKHPKDHDIYQPMFIEYDKQTVEELFPKEPFTLNPLNDIYFRLLHFPVILRKEINQATGWSNMVFYRKTRVSAGPTRWDLVCPEMTWAEREKVIGVTLRILEQYLDYVKMNYCPGISLK